MSVLKTITGLLKVSNDGSDTTEKVSGVNNNPSASVAGTLVSSVHDSETGIAGIMTKPVAGRSRYSATEKWLIIREGEVAGIKTVCDRYKISSWTWKYWQKKRDKAISETDKMGLGGLEDKKSGAKEPINKLSEGIELEIEKECQRCPGLGPSQIKNQLRRRGLVVSIKSVRRVMIEKSGYRTAPMKKAQEPAVRRFEADRPRELVQMDILEFYVHKQKTYLLLCLDDFSRFIMGWGLFTEATMEKVMEVFSCMIERYGKVEKVLTDRAMVFYSWKGINQFQKLLEEYEIDQLVSAPHHPQTLGKVEAVNKNIQKELIRVIEFSSLLEAEEKISEWIKHYNYTRTHQGIGGVLVPADRFFGREQEVMEKIARQVNSVAESTSLLTAGKLDDRISYELELNGRAINIFQVIKSGEELVLWVLGRSVTLNLMAEK